MSRFLLMVVLAYGFTALMADTATAQTRRGTNARSSFNSTPNFLRNYGQYGNLNQFLLPPAQAARRSHNVPRSPHYRVPKPYVRGGIVYPNTNFRVPFYPYGYYQNGIRFGVGN